MTIRFLRAWRWYKRGQTLEVASSIGKLWELMGHVERVPPDLENAGVGVVETAESRENPETAVAVPPLRRRRVHVHVPQPSQDN